MGPRPHGYLPENTSGSHLSQQRTLFLGLCRESNVGPLSMSIGIPKPITMGISSDLAKNFMTPPAIEPQKIHEKG